MGIHDRLGDFQDGKTTAKVKRTGLKKMESLVDLYIVRETSIFLKQLVSVLFNLVV